MKSVKSHVNKWVSRGLDRHVRLAVTGLSRAGKTAFITSLINQLLHSATNPRMPLFQPVREGRVLGARRVQQTQLHIPAFDYDQGIQALRSQPPRWPSPTRDVSEIRLAIRYRPDSGAMKLLQETATLYVDIVDYPGEWLLDLPLLSMSFDEWSRKQSGILIGKRKALAEDWLASLETFDPLADADEARIAELSEKFTAYLHACKDEAGLHWVQPGRFVLPGEYAGAPVLQFFPLVNEKYGESQLAQASPSSNYAILKQRYDYYCQHIIKGFYQDHFSKVDRQIVLVDTLQPLNAGPESFNDMRLALEQLMQSFRYGKSGLLRRLFAPSIDKILFAATKADHVTPDQHPNLVSLLQQLIHEAWQTAAFEGIDMECISLASIQATEPGMVDHKGESVSALRGTLETGEPMLMYPGDVPPRLPNDAFWQNSHFEFRQFRPMPNDVDEPLPHIRVDKALQYLLGDKLR
ncbi:nucleoside triphosphate hydrolase [Enterovibrio norvegicus FF-33]|uniref:Nucleoside triphosphate hydrolase n=1 Tax=Enterovibrio norvegicus FF-454 TaxID=1185651 RepID=A0A1E5C2G3_9GAMM|nr:YcjX family protein [Enterovibrio norvegicus]OEE59673.1 nucleoside triphosphate hydrolase [Enterovibrio norvegicus FF-454]OEE70234.1 nucleoside triphosphate hydrolase [Enterovibrio norvegicus FF-33]OEE87938.1 nucleoside triphosphate hydrolase [Enterovibrio norvegicus FF-162]